MSVALHVHIDAGSPDRASDTNSTRTGNRLERVSRLAARMIGGAAWPGAGFPCRWARGGIALLMLGWCLGVSVGAAKGEPNLVARWRFDQASGSTVLDDGGKYPGTLGQGAAFAAGVSGNALALTGSADSYAFVGDVLPMTNSTMSIALWFRALPKNASALSYLIAKHNPGIGSGYFIALNTAPRTMAVYAGQQQFVVARDVNDGTWHHVLFTVAPQGKLNLYLDGEHVLGVDDRAGIQPVSVPLTFGGAWVRGSFEGLRVCPRSQIFDDQARRASMIRMSATKSQPPALDSVRS